MDSREFSEWIAYYSIEPFGEERADWRNAMVPYLLTQVFSKKGKKKSKFEDFMFHGPDEDPVRTQRTTDMERKLKSLAIMYGAVNPKDGNSR